MGLYIRPATLVEEQGIHIEVPASWTDAQALLPAGAQLAAVATRGFGKVALLITGQPDFDHVRKVGCNGLYIIDSTLAAKAS